MVNTREEFERKLAQPSPLTREELQSMLVKLEQVTPQLITQHPDDADFMPLFADRADAIARMAGAGDYEWVMDRIDAILDKNGKMEGEYLPPNDSQAT
ncbi:hypothetical protein [Dyella sp. S184]|jgi:hypothetical protein|uniref:hypothetical protein n=1 Tax=Dyella sp. S184 TaxID=1641862 RepID=UPI00131D2B79|nr:hypothetical protein [Dyella sp. S184]